MNNCFYKNYIFVLGILLGISDLYAAEMLQDTAQILFPKSTKISAFFDSWDGNFEPSIRIVLPDNMVREVRVQANQRIAIEDHFRPFKSTDIFQYTIVSKYGDVEGFMQIGTGQLLDENNQSANVDPNWTAIQLSFRSLGASCKQAERPWYECRVKGRA